MAKKIYDGSECVLGRLGSVIAKDLLKGDSVDLINCNDIIVSGDKKLFVKKISAKREMGRGASLKGPKYPAVSDRLVKRMIRGMLPRDRTKGQDSIRRLKCYTGDIGDKDSVVIKLEFKKPMKYFKIKDVVNLLR